MKHKPVQSKNGTPAFLRKRRKNLPNICVARLIRGAAKCLVRALHTRLMEHGVSYGHWAFLRILWERDGLTQRELSIEAGVMEPTTFSALKTMEQLGYIKRRQTDGNKKNVYIHLTPKGRALEPKLMQVAVDVNGIALRGVKAADIATARKLLLKLIANLDGDEISAPRPSRAPRRQKRGNGISLEA